MEYKGELKGFPQEVVEAMLYYQEQQGNKRDITVFEKDPRLNKAADGFSWYKTLEGTVFWDAVIDQKDFELFFKEYPKKEFVLPEKWYIKGCDDLRKHLKNENTYWTGDEDNLGYFIKYNKWDVESVVNVENTNYTEITFDQFKKYVLMEKETAEDRINRLEKELAEVKQQYKKENEFAEGDIVVVKTNIEAGVGNGVYTHNLISILYSKNNQFETRPTGVFFDENCEFVVKENGKYLGIYKDHIKRKATPKEIEEFNKPKLPKIGCREGEITKNHIKYGDLNLSKRTLLRMKKVGIVGLALRFNDEKFLVKETDLELIYKACE